MAHSSRRVICTQQAQYATPFLPPASKIYVVIVNSKLAAAAAPSWGMNQEHIAQTPCSICTPAAPSAGPKDLLTPSHCSHTLKFRRRQFANPLLLLFDLKAQKLAMVNGPSEMGTCRVFGPV
jgi:hypothetical protein